MGANLVRDHRYWTLSGKPLGGWPDADTFVQLERTMAVPGPGQALTRTIYISLDPYQWAYKRRGIDVPGSPCHARTVAQVIESRMSGFSVGDFVFNTNGWSEYGLMGEGVARPVYMIPRRLDPSQGRISQAVGVLGMLGLTAYAGMIVVGAPKARETAVVSAASGGVGQIAGQLAKLCGARVVGIAGRQEKCRYVVDALNFDACVSHLSPEFPSLLREACPDGVDIYFENVGGKVFDAVLPLFNPRARMIVCGLISSYGDSSGKDERSSIANRGEAIFRERNVEVRDLFVGDYVESHQESFLQEVSPLVAEGKLKYREDVRQGFERIPEYFSAMLRGDNFGKMLVQVSQDPT